MSPSPSPRRFAAAFVALASLAIASLWLRCDNGPPIPAEEAVQVPGEGRLVVFVEAPRYLAAPILKLFTDQTSIVVEATYREEAGPAFYDQLDAAASSGKADLLWGASPLVALDL